MCTYYSGEWCMSTKQLMHQQVVSGAQVNNKLLGMKLSVWFVEIQELPEPVTISCDCLDSKAVPGALLSYTAAASMLACLKILQHIFY